MGRKGRERRERVQRGEEAALTQISYGCGPLELGWSEGEQDFTVEWQWPLDVKRWYCVHRHDGSRHAHQLMSDGEEDAAIEATLLGGGDLVYREPNERWSGDAPYRPLTADQEAAQREVRDMYLEGLRRMIKRGA